MQSSTVIPYFYTVIFSATISSDITQYIFSMKYETATPQSLFQPWILGVFQWVELN